MDFRKLDPVDMHSQIVNFPKQIEDALAIGEGYDPKGVFSDISSVVIAGMGGSGIGGDLIRALTVDSANTPIEVVRDYCLPAWVDGRTLVICVSYSGNTEETLSCLGNAIKRGAKVAGITSGGEMESRLNDVDGNVIKIPGGNPPRASLGYVSIPALVFLQKCDLTNYKSINKDLQDASGRIKQLRDDFSDPSDRNSTFVLAKTVYDSVPIIYGDARYTGAVALRWRGQLEENGKMLAFHHTLPEMNHNEIVGYKNNPDLLKRMGIIWLIDKDQHERTTLRQSLTRKLIGETVCYQEEVRSRGTSLAERLLYLVHFGDWVSYWCAVLHGVDPTPVERIESLKAKLAEND